MGIECAASARERAAVAEGLAGAVAGGGGRPVSVCRLPPGWRLPFGC